MLLVLKQKLSQCFKLEQAFVAKFPSPYGGIVLALVSTGLFVFVGVMVRLLSETIPVIQILFFRQTVFLVLLLPIALRALDSLLKPRQVGLHMLRVGGAFVALYLGFLTVSHIPLADATALGFSKVLFVAVISQVFLAESVGLLRKLTLAVGFLGVMLVVQPSFTESSLFYIACGLLAAIGAAVAVVCVRHLSQTESRLSLLVYQALFVAFIALIPSILVWQWPTRDEVFLLVLVGVVSSLAQWIGVSAYKYSEANIIANVEYAKMLYALLFGYFLFAEIPNTIAMLGVLLILGSAIIPLVRLKLKLRAG